MKGLVPTETAAPMVEMVPFPQTEALPPLPPAPGEQPVSLKRLRVAFAGQAIGALGALLLLASLFISGWYHVNRIDVIFGDRPLDDSYIGHSLTLATNYYSLAVWAFLKRGEAIPAVVAAVLAAAASLLIVGKRRRGIVALGLLLAIIATVWIASDLRHLSATVLGLAKDSSVGPPSAIRLNGARPGPMMFLGFGGLTLQIGGACIAFLCLPRVRRTRRISRAKRQPKREEQTIGEFEPRGTGEYAIEGAATLPQHAADERWREGHGQEDQQYPG
jgi:hypothetical protein